MPAPAYTTNPEGATPDTPRSDSSWYSAFATEADGSAKARPAASASPASENAIPDALDTLTASDIPGPHTRNNVDGATLPALLHLQHAELERLVRDNERLMDRIETLLQIQGREQILRQQMQNQVDRIGEQIKLAPPTEALEAVRREARAGVTEEIKPVLMAILDALERFADKSASKAPAMTAEPDDDPYQGEDYGNLPAILTRPLHELMDDGRDPGRFNSSASQHRPRKPLFHNRKRTRTEGHNDRESAAGTTSPFTWTTVFSS